MAEEPVEEAKKEEVKKKLGSKTKLLIIIAVAAALLGAGGWFGYTMFFGKDKKADGEHAKKPTKTMLVPLDPFVVNLSEQGRYLKITIQFEMEGLADENLIKEKIPMLRDMVITLLSSKSTDSVSGPEGKFQLKDELLLRANQAMGREVFKNLYFTEFVMQ